MAEELFQAGICSGESWWNINNSTRSSLVFPLMSPSSTCSIAANNDGAGNYNTWQNDFMDLKEGKCCADQETNNFVSNSFVDANHHKPQQSELSASGTDSIFMEPSLQVMRLGVSSSTCSLNWNQSLFRNCGRPENNFHSVMNQEETCMDSCNNSQIQKDWSDQNHVSTTVDSFKPMNEEFPLLLDQQSLNSISSSTGLSISGGFPIESSAGSYGNNYPPLPLMQNLYEQPQNSSIFTNNPCMSSSYSSNTTNYGATCSNNELSPPTWSKVSSMPKQQQQLMSGLHFTNNTPFWNASADEALDDIRAGAVFAASSQPQPKPKPQYQTPTFEDKSNCSTTTLLNKLKREESPEAKKSASEPAIKRPRIETPSPLPTFKVRKEKLGDRITALQQLVSPFGKTDTASVLHEAIEYIKFLHDQVNVLSTPYMKNGAPVQHHQGYDDNVEDSEGGKELRRRGLCLVPIASTFPVANETSVDFWTPTFGGGALLSR